MKIPKRKKSDEQTLLFDLEEYTTGTTEEVLIDNLFDDVEELFEETNPTDVGLVTNEIYCGDTVETMKKIEDKSINLILTSPPYLASIRKDNHKYPGAKDIIKDNQPVKEYLEWLVEVFKQYERILSDDGAIVFNYSYTTFNPSLPYLLINEVGGYRNNLAT